MDAIPALPLAADDRRHPAFRLLLLGAWLAAALFLVSHHAMWRDEVRAYSLALTGEGVVDMLRAVQGEGHPALWYLLLRGAHAVWATPLVLPGVALAVGTATAIVLAWRAPFRPLVIAMALFGGWTLHEYTVVARNYGVAALLLFVFAWRYTRGPGRGVVLGMLLALLCNTNAPAVLLAAGLCLFWLVELVATGGWRPDRRWRPFFVAVTIAALGVVAFLAEVYPPHNDAAVSPLAGRLTPLTVLIAAFNVAAPFDSLVPLAFYDVPLMPLVLAALLVGSVAGLIRSPAGTVAAAWALIALPLFFQLVYPGAYRHQALFVAYLLALYWMVALGRGGAWRADRARDARVARGGQAAMLALLALQVPVSIAMIAAPSEGIAWSRSRDVARLLRRPPLRGAAVMANPDVLLEPLPYYVDNPLWLTRERRWGTRAEFTKKAQVALSLGGILADARRIRAATGRPVVILMQPPLDPAAAPATWQESYLGTLTVTPAEIRAFLAATRHLGHYGPTVTDECYDVYVLA